MKNGVHVSGTEAEAHNYLNIFSLMNNKKTPLAETGMCLRTCAAAHLRSKMTPRLCDCVRSY